MSRDGLDRRNRPRGCPAARRGRGARRHVWSSRRAGHRRGRARRRPISRDAGEPRARRAEAAARARRARRARQQRRHRATRAVRGRSGRGVGRVLAAQRDELRARDPRGTAAPARRRRGDRERVVDGGQAAVDRHAALLGDEGGGALALAPRRGPVREGRDPLQRGDTRADRDGRVARRRWARRPAGRPGGSAREGRAPDGRSGGLRDPRRLPPSSSSSAPSAPRTSPARPGAPTAAPFRSSCEGRRAAGRRPHAARRARRVAGRARRPEPAAARRRRATSTSPSRRRGSFAPSRGSRPESRRSPSGLLATRFGLRELLLGAIATLAAARC